MAAQSLFKAIVSAFLKRIPPILMALVTAAGTTSMGYTMALNITAPSGTATSSSNFTFRESAILYASPAAAPSGNCSSWANACTLQTALAASISGDEIWVVQGTHKPSASGDRAATFQLKNGVGVYGGFVGTETLRSQRNYAINITILSGDLNGNDNTNVYPKEPTRAENAYHVVTGSGTDNTAILDGFTVTGGNATIMDRYPSIDYGGGMENTSGSPSVANVVFTSNSAYRTGGAISNQLDSNPSLVNVTIDHNTSDNMGGGIYNNASSPTLTNVTITNNMASASGGGIYNDASSPTITNVTIANNTASKGGGIFNDASSPTLTSVTIADNNAGAAGGGIYNDASSPILINVTITGNTSPSLGGGGLYLANSGSPLLINVTLARNIANRGGAILIDANVNPIIHNSILWRNRGLNIHTNGGVATIDYSVISEGCPFLGNCSNIITVDPLLGALGSYGGSTQTIPLLPGSPAIDAGNPGDCLPQDQRGLGRVGTCDIGAFESQGFTFTSQTGTPQSAVINTAFSTALGLTVTANHAGEPVDNGVITFSAPSSGASITTPSFTKVITSGTVSQSVTANGTVGGPYNVTASASGAASVNFALTNSDVIPTVTLAASPGSLAENAAASMAYTFMRSGNTASAITVDFSVSGTAGFGTDYTQTGAETFSATAGTVTFPAGSSTTTITIEPSADTTVELYETVILTLAEGTGYTAGSPEAAAGTITNDDSAAASIANASAAEGGSLLFAVTLTNPSDALVSLMYSTADGTSTTSDSDYTAKIAQTLTIPAGQMSGTITVATTADTKPETDETITVSLSEVAAGGRSVTLGANTSGTGTIQNNDFVPSATTNPATAITTSAATLNGTVNANNASASVTFEYGTDTTYGTTVTAAPTTVTGSANISVSSVLTGLTPDTIYHYRVTATNAAGTTSGLDQTFKTAKPAPANTNLASLSISSGSLTPTFNPATTQYTVVVDKSIASLTVTPAAVEAQASITVNAVAVPSGAASGPIALKEGTNTITIVVTVQGSSKIYTITVTRLPEWKVYLPIILK